MSGSFAGDRQAVKLARQSDGEIAHVDHFLDLALAFGPDLAGLKGDQETEIGLSGAKRSADLAHDLAAPRRGDNMPALERLAGPRDDPLVISDRRHPDRGQRLARCRVRRLDRRRRRRIRRRHRNTRRCWSRQFRADAGGLQTWRRVFPSRNAAEFVLCFSSYRRSQRKDACSMAKQRLILPARSTKMVASLQNERAGRGVDEAFSHTEAIQGSSAAGIRVSRPFAPTATGLQARDPVLRLLS